MSDHAPACADSCDRLRAIEPVLFFGGLLFAVAVGVTAVVVDSLSQVGPASAQPAHLLQFGPAPVPAAPAAHH